MKVKKLEWVKISSLNQDQVNSKCSKYSIDIIKNYISAYERSYTCGFNFLGDFETLEQAQEACQKHFEEFILSNIKVGNES